ncbi:MAG: penicillin-binding protein, partial [Candidatus Omnitrophica bacterium]|nr:penicillin-binding protein [Candidatus Omnitrophota bacterium]
MLNTIKKKRQITAVFAFCVCIIAIIARLFYLQIVQYPNLKDKADLQHTTVIQLAANRGIIYDRNNRILASNIGSYSVYAVSKDIDNEEEIAAILSHILNVDEEITKERLGKKKSFVWIKRKISEEELANLRKANIPNIGFIEEPKRFYPNTYLGCHLIGFTDIDLRGIEGIELSYNKYLSGRDGWRRVLRDARGTPVPALGECLPPRDGYGLILTVDEFIQHIAEKEIDSIVTTYRPKSVMIIAMDPNTGQILAMANYPRFDSNNYKNTAPEFFKNRCLTDSIEPGSVFKVITASAVLEEGVVSFDDKFDCENGSYKIGNRTLHDYRPYGTLTFREVIEKSSNIGTAKAAEKLGEKKLHSYVRKFGFGSLSGIDMPGEENGIVRDVSKWSYVDMTTVPMGQGISCTALQLANAVSAIANGGMLMRPYIVNKIINKEKNVIKEFSPKAIRKVMSPETASKVKELLYGVVKRGTGKKAGLDGYDACGKTGTA